MPTAATPRASVRRSSSCLVSNRMDPSILVGWRLSPAVRNAVTAITRMAIAACRRGPKKGRIRGSAAPKPREGDRLSIDAREAARLLQSTSQIDLRRDRRAHMPNSSLSVRPVEAIDCALARSSSLFLGVEKPCPVPL